NEEIRRQSSAFARQLSSLRARYERLERSLTNARAEVAAADADIGDSATLCEELRQEVVWVRAQAEEAQRLFEGIGPVGLGVARRLGRVQRRFPRAGAAAGRSVRLVLSAKRKAARNTGEC
ncbi:MAG: hypothetical protein M3Z84_05075, partial [Actinomycetota bacterium]|nr:hypothetical protein [Actinomycetota bacterium]